MAMSFRVLPCRDDLADLGLGPPPIVPLAVPGRFPRAGQPVAEHDGGEEHEYQHRQECDV
ncbi:hypothetical protein ACFFX0_22265 [Citricoccus parietis]|uniref:Uncharacterized protein n=1 Tax=Citricoccus parietis TaxID=592307 RepID=A0ABV5G4B7_9MICC